MKLEQHILVHRGEPTLLPGDLSGKPAKFLLVTYSHEDAGRLARLLSTPTHRLSPAPINLRGGSLDSLMERLCKSDSRIVGAALFTGWHKDDRPKYTLAVCGSRSR
ncbi:MAG: hypothetical protein IBJ18_01575 [Phycisphaerales bacterium]|nr:hypothetical protein [Phycisphaerales bacterium]